MGLRDMIYEARRAKVREERKKQALATAAGTLAGVLVGILFAPQSGKETREQIALTAKDTSEKVMEKSKEAGKYVKEKASDAYEIIMDKQEEFRNSIKEKYQDFVDHGMTELSPVLNDIEEGIDKIESKIEELDDVEKE